MGSEHGDHTDNAVVDDQRLACKSHYPLALNPWLAGQDGILRNVIGGICYTLPCDSLDLLRQQGIPRDLRMGSSAGFELQQVGCIIEVPHAGKSQVEVADEAVDAERQTFAQDPAARQRSPNFGRERLQIRTPCQLTFRASTF